MPIRIFTNDDGEFETKPTDVVDFGDEFSLFSHKPIQKPFAD